MCKCFFIITTYDKLFLVMTTLLTQANDVSMTNDVSKTKIYVYTIYVHMYMCMQIITLKRHVLL